MQENSIKITINAPIEKVFNVLTDYEKLKVWAKGIEKIEPIEGKPTTTGFKYYTYIKEGARVTKYTSEVLSSIPPKHISMSSSAKGMTLILNYNLYSVAEGTTLESSYSMETKSKFLKFIGWLFAGLTKKMATKQLTALKKYCEQGL